MKKTLILILLLVTATHFAQQHIATGDYSCKVLGVKKGTESILCPACAKKKDQEKKAIAAEQKRRNDAIAAIAEANRIARQKAFDEEQKKKLDEAKSKSGEVVINAQPQKKIVPKKTSKNDFYEIVIDNRSDWRPIKRHCKILKNKVTSFETDDFNSIHQVYNQEYFVGRNYSITCLNSIGNVVDDKGNNSVLIDPTGKIIELNGIKKFGFLQTAFQDSDDQFEIVVYTGECEEVTNDRYDKSRWSTIRYKFSFETMSLISTEKSAQNSSHSCGEFKKIN